MRLPRYTTEQGTGSAPPDWAVIEARGLLWKLGATCTCQRDDVACRMCGLVAKALRDAKDAGTRMVLRNGAPIERMFTINDIAAAVGVERGTVDAWIAKGKMGSIKLGNGNRQSPRRIPASAYRTMLERTGVAWKPRKKRQRKATIVGV
ncbi:MAG: hypothetical protein V4510_11485 [bacterium]